MPDPVIAGNYLQYNLTITNYGPSDASNVVVYDTLPSGVSLNYASPSALGSYPTYHWNLGTISAGDSETIIINVSVAGNVYGIIYNNANVTSDTSDTNLSNNNAIEETNVYQPTNLTITKTDSADPVMPGDIFNYTIKIRNIGDIDANNVTIRERYDKNITFISSSPPPMPGNNDTWIASIPSGGTLFINISVRVKKPLDNGTVIFNYVNVTCNGTYGEATETTTVISSPEIHISKESIPLYAESGANVLYRIIVTNNGTMRATNVIIRERYDKNITFISSSPPPMLGNNDTWIFDELMPGDFIEIDINARTSNALEEGDIVMNNVNVTCDQNSSDEANATTFIISYPPETHKQFNGKVINITIIDGSNGYILHFIPVNTTITLVAVDNGSGVNKTFYRIFKLAGGVWRILFDWEEYGVWNDSLPYFPIDLASLGELYNYSACGKYEIEFYSIDNAGNIEEPKWNDVFVDCFPPVTEIEMPYEIRNESFFINVNASDFGVGIDRVLLYYKYSEDNESWSPWILYGERKNNFTWIFNASDGYYKFYSVGYDLLGNHEALPNNTTIPKAMCRVIYPWDINGDRRVNVNDLYLLIIHWMQSSGSENWDARVDVNHDGIINEEDIDELITHWTG